MHHTGGCLCGRVRYELHGPALATAICHCRNCQKQSGAAFSVNLVAREDQVSISGTLASYEDKGESGFPVYRRFCARCGSPILSALGSSPGILAVKAGTLDDPGFVSPSLQVWCDSRQPWLESLPGLPAFNRDVPKTT